jgi:hypothetical protein
MIEPAQVPKSDNADGHMVPGYICQCSALGCQHHVIRYPGTIDQLLRGLRAAGWLIEPTRQVCPDCLAKADPK